jgi:hypothetical protein
MMFISSGQIQQGGCVACMFAAEKSETVTHEGLIQTKDRDENCGVMIKLV